MSSITTGNHDEPMGGRAISKPSRRIRSIGAPIKDFQGSSLLSVRGASEASANQLVASKRDRAAGLFDEGKWTVILLGWLWYVFIDGEEIVIGASETAEGARQLARERLEEWVKA